MSKETRREKRAARKARFKAKSFHARFWIVTGIVVASIIALLFFGNSLCSVILRGHIRSLKPVVYEHQLQPEKGVEGYVTFTTDKEFRVMEINDIHLGGGLWTLKKDMKTLYEVANMVEQEKPDLVVLAGDSVFAVPGPIFNGGGTLNNAMASRVVMYLFERLGVYYTVAFGNHDTEAFDYVNRKSLGKMYMSDYYAPYCVFECNFSGYGVTNQIILIKDGYGNITKALLIMDSNDYIDNSISASINWLYDTIHDEQVEWAKDSIELIKATTHQDFGVLAFFHIPTGEFECAYRELAANNFQDTENTKYLEGVWDELVDEAMGGRIWYGGCSNKDVKPEDNDRFFEVLGPDGIDCLEGIFVGHDHVNSAVVLYKGVMLSYGYAMDNTAYSGIERSGRQRGCTVITIDKNGGWVQRHKNTYFDYAIDPNKYFPVDLSDYFYEGAAPVR